MDILITESMLVRFNYCKHLQFMSGYGNEPILHQYGIPDSSLMLHR